MSKQRVVRATAVNARERKWDSASRIINDVRAIFDRNHQEISRYGLEDTYTDVNAFADGLRERELPGQAAMGLLLAFRDWAPMAFWDRHKQVYTMHPTMTRELRATGVDDKLPGEMLRRLPHPDPMIVFPEGIAIELPEGERGRLIAINVCGAQITGPGHANFTSTIDESTNGLYLNALTEVYNSDGVKVDWDYCHTSIPCGDGTFTIGGVIDATRDYVSFDGRQVVPGLTERKLAYVHQVVGIALSHLLYVVSSNADIAPPRNTTRAEHPPLAAAGPRRTPQPIPHQPVGYKVGPALDAARRQHEQKAVSAASSGGTKAPHWRSAHFHTVRTGVGRVNSEVRWFGPIPVNADGKPLKHPTIHGY